MSSYIDFRAIAEEHLAANRNANLYFLLDHAGMPGLHSLLLRSSTEWSSLFEDTKEESALCVAPILVLVGSNGVLKMPRSLFRWISENGTYTSSVILLASLLPISVMKLRLAVRLDVRLSEDMNAMLRFFDPRVFEQLINVLSTEQLRFFLSPAEKWWYVGRAGELLSMNAEFDIDDRIATPLQLSNVQEFQLLDASEPDQVLALLRENAPHLMSKILLSRQYTFVVSHIRAAREVGLTSTLDFVIYSSAALLHGEDFPVGPVWSKVFNDMKIKGINFSQAVDINDSPGRS